MSMKLRRDASPRKKTRFPSGNQNCLAGNQISPVMQKVRGSLGGHKAAQELAFLTSQPLSICQKLLSGHRIENREMLGAIFQTRLVTSAVIALTEGTADPDAKALRKFAQKLELKRQLAALDEEGA